MQAHLDQFPVTSMCRGGTPYIYTITSRIYGDHAPRTIQDACDITQACTFYEPQVMFGWGFTLSQGP